MKRITASALFFLFLAACQSNEIGHSRDVNQDEICQSYLINYDAAKDKTEITAFFRFAGPNGTTLILDSTSNITLDGEPLSEVQDNSMGCYYHKSVTGKLADKEYVFAFTDLNNKKFENKLNFTNIQIEPLTDTLYRGDGLTIHFTDKPEGRNENMTVEITDDSTTVSQTWQNVYFERIKFPKEKLDKLHGAAFITIKREGLFNLKQHTHAGGAFYTQYELAPKKIVLVE